MNKFKNGDKVKVVNDFNTWFHEWSDSISYEFVVLTVVENNGSDTSDVCPQTYQVNKYAVNSYPEDFELVVDTCGEAGKEEIVPLGVYRPNLEDRKVGKVPMHMVTDGFPNALRHVAEIMGWAAVTKGYKLHDWKNLPDAEIALPDAADRHGNDNSIQKAEGLSALERVDHESAKLHIGHRVFNLLAELELVLTGKIK